MFCLQITSMYHQYIVKSCTEVYNTALIFTYTLCFCASYVFVSQFALLHNSVRTLHQKIPEYSKEEDIKHAGHVTLRWVPFL